MNFARFHQSYLTSTEFKAVSIAYNTVVTGDLTSHSLWLLTPLFTQTHSSFENQGHKGQANTQRSPGSEPYDCILKKVVKTVPY